MFSTGPGGAWVQFVCLETELGGCGLSCLCIQFGWHIPPSWE